ncbi:hypothetical protein SBA4_1580003 [Candidatus Sulfopaludibacter sp. SbA4]|nr:hypothetical protein SBA4_1580003 [Candidatus Sulfopaludibacter sp. SbA4]
MDGSADRRDHQSSVQRAIEQLFSVTAPSRGTGDSVQFTGNAGVGVGFDAESRGRGDKRGEERGEDLSERSKRRSASGSGTRASRADHSVARSEGVRPAISRAVRKSA